MDKIYHWIGFTVLWLCVITGFVLLVIVLCGYFYKNAKDLKIFAQYLIDKKKFEAYKNTEANRLRIKKWKT